MKYRFASNEWFAALHAIFCERARLVAETEPGFSYSICEVLTNVPGDLATLPGRRTAWHAIIRGADVMFERTERDDVELKNVADYESVLPLARFDTGNSRERAATLQQMSQALLADGRLQIVGTPRRNLGPFRSIHDAIARLTE